MFEQIVQDVLAECARQNEKWGEKRNHNLFTWITVLSEEVGELAQAALHYKFGGPAAINLRTEAIHVAAVIFQLIECFDRDEWDWND